MKKAVVLIFFLSFTLFFAGGHLSAQNATKEDLKQLVHYLDKRFEAIDKRFEDVNKRFDMMMWFVGILTVLGTSMISFVMMRLMRHQDKVNNFEKNISSKDNIIDITQIIEAIQYADAKSKKQLKDVLLKAK